MKKFFILYLILFSSSFEEIPQEQKDLCQGPAKNSDDCLVDLDDGYYCCYMKAKTVEFEQEASLCAVLDSEEVTKRTIKELLGDFAPLIRDIIFNDVGLMTYFSVFYRLIESGLKEQELQCPIDPETKKGKTTILTIVLTVSAVFITGIIIYCCCCQKGGK